MSSEIAKLRFLTGKLSGKAYPLTKTLVLGRAPNINGKIPGDAKVSREHSKIFKQGDDYCIVDLNSRNGTQVNDAPVTKRTLHDGDEVTIGETRFRFELPEPKIEEPVVKPRESQPAFREVIDLTAKPEVKSAPAGALRADEIVVKDDALQFSKVEGRKKPNALFDDLGQRSFFYQATMGLVILAASIGFLLLGLYLAGLFGD